jgi:hypothetical protein
VDYSHRKKPGNGRRGRSIVTGAEQLGNGHQQIVGPEGLGQRLGHADAGPIKALF